MLSKKNIKGIFESVKGEVTHNVVKEVKLRFCAGKGAHGLNPDTMILSIYPSNVRNEKDCKFDILHEFGHLIYAPRSNEDAKMHCQWILDNFQIECNENNVLLIKHMLNAIYDMIINYYLLKERNCHPDDWSYSLPAWKKINPIERVFVAYLSVLYGNGHFNIEKMDKDALDIVKHILEIIKEPLSIERRVKGEDTERYHLFQLVVRISNLLKCRFKKLK